MIIIQRVDPQTQLPKGNAYSASLCAGLESWARSAAGTPDASDTPNYKKGTYVAGQVTSMASTLKSEEESKSAWRGYYSIAIFAGQMVGICKTNIPGKPLKISLILSMPDSVRAGAGFTWPKPSPVSCLIAEVASRAPTKPLKLEADDASLVPFYAGAYKFVVIEDAQKPVMELADTSALIAKYQQGVAWTYAEPLPHIPG